MSEWNKPNFGLSKIPKSFLETWKDVDTIRTTIVGVGTSQELLDIAFHSIPTGSHSLRPLVIHKISFNECDVCGKKFEKNECVVFRGKISDRLLYRNNNWLSTETLKELITIHFGDCDCFTQIRGLI